MTLTASAKQMPDADTNALFVQAEQLVAKGEDKEAVALYEQCLGFTQMEIFAHFRLGEIHNRLGQPQKALVHHLAVFDVEPAFAKSMLAKEIPHSSYVYRPVEEIEVKQCPACGSRNGTLHSVYNCLQDPSFLPGFHPVKRWMRCGDCTLNYAASYPKNIAEILSSTAPTHRLDPMPGRFPLLGRAINTICAHTSGRSLLEVGVGAGEFVAVAAEFGLDVTGLDIRAAYAQTVAQRYNITAATADFMDYKPGRTFGIISMGDVLEHFIDPDAAIAKAVSLLNPDGVLWISTPNYESAYTRSLGTYDPMWRVTEHLTHFNRTSLEKLLAKHSLHIADYAVSAIYNGSMEITATRKTR